MDPIELSKWMRENQNIVQDCLDNGIITMEDVQNVFQFALEYDQAKQEYGNVIENKEYDGITQAD
jgi:hypothetical protein